MAGNAVIGALRVVLGADSAALDKGLKESQGKLQEFGATVSKFGLAAAAAFAGAATALGISVAHVIEQADKIGKSAQKIGIPVEQLSSLSLAAALSDVSMESLTGSVAKLGRSMTEAAAKPTSEAANAFRALGVGVVDANGKLRPVNDVLQDVAGKFAGLKDGAGKTAAAMAIFGKSGAELIPLLNSGKEGLQQMTAEAEQFGIVIDDKTAKAAEAFNDNLTRLTKVKEGLILKISAGLLPVLQSLSQMMIDSAKGVSSLDTVVRGLTFAIQGLVTGGVLVTTTFRLLNEVITAFAGSIGNLLKGNFAAAWAAAQKGITDVTATVVGAGDTVRKVWAGSSDGADKAAESTRGADKALKEFNFTALAGKTAFDQYLDSVKKNVAAQNAALQTDGMAAGAKERLKTILQGLQIAQANMLPVTDAMRQKMTEAANAIELVTLKLEGQRLIQQQESPWVVMQQQVVNATAALQAAGATAQQTGNALLAIRFPNFVQAARDATNFSKQVDGFVTSSIHSLASSLAQVITGAKSATEAFKDFAIQVITKLIEMIAEAVLFRIAMAAIGFSTGGPVSGGGGSFPGFAAGGPVGYAPGGVITGPGTPTSDSIPALLSDGEFVVNAAATRDNLDILQAINDGTFDRSQLTQPSNPTRNRTGGGTTTINLVGEFFDRSTIERLIPIFNEAARDGHTLRMA